MVLERERVLYATPSYLCLAESCDGGPAAANCPLRAVPPRYSLDTELILYIHGKWRNISNNYFPLDGSSAREEHALKKKKNE